MMGIKRKLADWLLMRSLRAHFRAVHLDEVEPLAPERPVIAFPNHSYWWDGHFVYLLAREWRAGKGMVWMKELGPFPPFEAVGAMPFPEDTVVRAATIRRTVRALRSSPCVLFLFPEGDLHSSPDLRPFERSLWWLHEKVPGAALVPTAIRVVQGVHQYPEAYILAGRSFASPSPEPGWLEEARVEVGALRRDLDRRVGAGAEGFRCIMAGRLSIDEHRLWGGNTRGPKPRHHRDDPK